MVGMKYLGYLGVTLVMAAVIGLITDIGWPGYLIGVVLAHVLFVMLWLPEPKTPRGMPSVSAFVVAAALTTAIGAVVAYAFAGADGSIGPTSLMGYPIAAIAMGLNVFGLSALREKADT